MEQARYPRRSYNRDYRRELRRESRLRRSSTLQRKYDFRGAKGSIVVVALMIVSGYLLWIGANMIYDFLLALLTSRTSL